MSAVLFVAPPTVPDRDRFVSRLREAGLTPVGVPNVSTALNVLDQFSVAAIVLYVEANAMQLEDCAKLIAAGTVIALIPKAATPARVERHLAAGCVAVMSEPFTASQFAAVMIRVQAGERRIVHPPFQT